MRTATKTKWGCAGLALIVCGYLFFFQPPFLIDPGLRDIHIRNAIKTLDDGRRFDPTTSEFVAR